MSEKKLRKCVSCGKGFAGSSFGRPAKYCKRCRGETLKTMKIESRQRLKERSTPLEIERRDQRAMDRYHGRRR